MSAIQISAIVPTYNRAHHLHECLKSLLNQSLSPDNYEIIVVDDDSNDGTGVLLESLMKENPSLRYLHQSHQGPCTARNLGAKKARGDLLYFTDDDCVVDRKCLEEMVKAYTNKNIGGLGGKILAYKQDTLAERYAEAVGILNQKKFIDRFVVTANASYPKQVFKEVGGFDPLLSHHTDVDIGMRIKRAGYLLKYVPKAIVYHKHRSSVITLLKQQYHYGAGHVFLHKKFPMHFSPAYLLYQLSRKIIYRFITYPKILVTTPFSRDKALHVVSPWLDVLCYLAYMGGALHEMLRRRKYRGEIIYDKFLWMGDL